MIRRALRITLMLGLGLMPWMTSFTPAPFSSAESGSPSEQGTFQCCIDAAQQTARSVDDVNSAYRRYRSSLESLASWLSGGRVDYLSVSDLSFAISRLRSRLSDLDSALFGLEL